MIIDIIGWEIGEAPRARQEGTHEDKGAPVHRRPKLIT